MRLVQVGLDKTTQSFLRENSVLIVDTGPIADVEELESWIKECDAVSIDITLPNFGVYSARHLRNKKINTPVIGISSGTAGRTWPEERAVFLENGGDDLIHGPPNPRELLASLRAMSRRFQGAVMSIAEFRRGAATLKVNMATRLIFVNGREPLLTQTEREMVLHMASNPGRVLTKEALLSNLYALRADDPPEIKIIDVFICKARKKISDVHPDAEKLIETVWGQGYRLSVEAEVKTAA